MKLKAIIFDMDGVIVDSESVWQEFEKTFLIDLFGEKIYRSLEHMVFGGSVKTIFESAQSLGFALDEHEYRKMYNKKAVDVYEKAKITKGFDHLMNYLNECNLKKGLVTASPFYWVEQVMKKLPNTYVFDCIVSIDEKNLQPKPNPEGYRYALKKLGIQKEEAIVIEDSNTGIASAKAAGIFTICLRQHLPTSYVSKDANLYVNTLEEIIDFLERNI